MAPHPITKNGRILFGALAVIAFIVASIFAIEQSYFLKSAELLNGEVTEIDELKSDVTPDPPSYQPVVSFTTAAGEVRKVNSKVGSRHGWPDAIGQEFQVYYNETTERAVINTFWNLWGAAITFLIVAIIFGAVAIVPNKNRENPIVPQ